MNPTLMEKSFFLKFSGFSERGLFLYELMADWGLRTTMKTRVCGDWGKVGVKSGYVWHKVVYIGVAFAVKVV